MPARGLFRRVLRALLVLGALAVLVGLGTWQLQRLAWKEALIAAASARPSLAPVPPPGPGAWAGLDMAEWDFRRVRLTGRFEGGEVLAWTALSNPKGDLGGQGYFVVAPFATDGGWTVFVNRGFVPDALRDPAARPGSAPPAEPVAVEGIVRRDDTPSSFTPAPDPARRLVFAREIATLASMLGVSGPVAPYTVDLVASETPPGGLPQAGESVLTFTNNHLQYALTWYGIAAALVGVVAAAFFHSRRGEPVGRPGD